MDLMEEIQALFADSDIDSAYKITTLPSDFPAWVVRFIDGFGVAIPYMGEVIQEEFANAFLYDTSLNLSGQNVHCLLLTSSIESSRNEFAAFCRDFVQPGYMGTLRHELLDDPTAWWTRWKLLIGNSIMEKRPYAVLGELVMYEYLLRNGRNVKWAGPSASSHDLICADEEYEVKSTLSRYESIIHVTGQFQLQQSSKRLYMYFCRFEKNVNGVSINNMVDKLVTVHGESRDALNGQLGKLGYNAGSSSRAEKYQLHEAMQYPVDETFPRIIPEMFKDGILPVGIKQLSYDVDLSVIPGTIVHVVENYNKL